MYTSPLTDTFGTTSSERQHINSTNTLISTLPSMLFHRLRELTITAAASFYCTWPTNIFILLHLQTFLSTAYDLQTFHSTAHDLLILLTTWSNLQKHDLEVLSPGGRSSLVGCLSTLPAFLCTTQHWGGHTVSKRNERTAMTAMDRSKRHVSGAWDTVVQRGVTDHRDIVNGCRLKLRGMLELGN